MPSILYAMFKFISRRFYAADNVEGLGVEAGEKAELDGVNV